MPEFEWDSNKNALNLQKHGISFEEASHIFNGSGPIVTNYDENFHEEDREISFGLLNGVVVVCVVHTERNGKIRLISARLATKREREKYYECIG